MIDTKPTIWVNGERQPFEAAHISARDRGFTLADAVFETMRARGSGVFRLDRHLDRLNNALRTLSIPATAEIREWVLAAVKAADLPEASIRVTVSRGIAPGGVIPPDDPQPTVVITVGPMPLFRSAIYENGLVASVASGRRNEHAMTSGLKTVNYTDSVAAMIEARRAGAEEALFLDTEGHCSEATASNLFVLIDGQLLTPPVSCAALPGITRQAVMEIARPIKLRVFERPFGLDDLSRADEAFLTSSLRGIAPLVRVGGQDIGSGRPGAVTKEIATAYAKTIAAECGA